MIELLVVIAIISILASMIFPSFGRAREMARRTSCASNMRQLGLAVIQYDQDYDGRLPGATVGSAGAGLQGGWAYYTQFGADPNPPIFDNSKGALYTYDKSTQIYVCPSDSIGQTSGNSYAINSCAMSQLVGGYAPGKSEAAFEETTKWMLFSEEKFYKTSTDDGYQQYNVNEFSDRHLEGSNIMFMDGHVKFIQLSRIKSSQFQTGGIGGASCP